MTVAVTLSASQQLTVNEVGDFFRLMEADLPVTVRFYRQGKKFAEAIGVRSGFAEEFEAGFDKVEIVNGVTPNDIQYVIRLGSRIAYDVPPIGQVSIVNTTGAFTQSEPAVTDAAGGVVVFAANPLRRYLLIQNNDPAANLRVTVDGSAPVRDGVPSPHGVKVEPGGTFELVGYQPDGAVRVIADQATAIVSAAEG